MGASSVGKVKARIVSPHFLSGNRGHEKSFRSLLQIFVDFRFRLRSGGIERLFVPARCGMGGSSKDGGKRGGDEGSFHGDFLDGYRE